MSRRGFTIVELIVVISIMAILLVLAVVNLRGSQISARDDERKNDVKDIAMHAETYYNSGNNAGNPTGTYPSTITSSNTNDFIRTVLVDINIKSLLAPGITDENTKSFISATNDDQTVSGILPQPTIDQYVYQPLRIVGSTYSLCTSSVQGCRKFNMYYRLEADNQVYKVTSKNQ